MSRFNSFKTLYFEFLPIVFPSTIIIGLFSNLSSGSGAFDVNKNVNSSEIFLKSIGYTSIVITTGLTYPISYPLLGCYFLYKNK